MVFSNFLWNKLIHDLNYSIYDRPIQIFKGKCIRSLQYFHFEMAFSKRNNLFDSFLIMSYFEQFLRDDGFFLKAFTTISM